MRRLKDENLRAELICLVVLKTKKGREGAIPLTLSPVQEEI